MPVLQASSGAERFLYLINFPAMLVWMFTSSAEHRVEQTIGQDGARYILIDKFGRAEQVGVIHYWLSTHPYWLSLPLLLGLIAAFRARRRANRQ